MAKKNKIKKKIKSKNKKKKILLKKPVTQNVYKSNIFKSNDVKVKIKKVVKQPTEKRSYNIKDYVVYPKHGVGKILSVEKAKIGNIDITFYKVFIEKEKLTLSIPLNQQSHLRPISSINQINKAINILKIKPKIKKTMWSRRAQEYEAKILSGNLVSIAEVLKDLYKKDSFDEASFSEKQIYASALDRLARELAAMKKLDKETATKELEKILKSAA